LGHDWATARQNRTQRTPETNEKAPQKAALCRHIWSGETRTRTGDTTIFSRAAVASETGPFAGSSLASGHVYGVRVFPDFAPLSPALRQMAGVVCLLVVAMAILTAGRGGAARRLPLALGYEVAVLTL
jgi:hypothetical protein